MEMYRADQDIINYDRNMIACTQLWALYRAADHYDLDGLHLEISPFLNDCRLKKVLHRSFRENKFSMIPCLLLYRWKGSEVEGAVTQQSSAIVPLGMLLPFCVRFGGFARNSQRCTHPPAQPLSIFVVNICSRSRIS